MTDTAAPTPAPAAPNPVFVWWTWTLDLLKLPAVTNAVGTFMVALAAVITANWATKPADKAPIPAADMPSIVTHEELTKAHADLAARIANNHAEFRKAMDEVKALIQSQPASKKK